MEREGELEKVFGIIDCVIYLFLGWSLKFRSNCLVAELELGGIYFISEDFEVREEELRDKFHEMLDIFQIKMVRYASKDLI